ncbi:MAG: tetratricopeptide repeat protein [Erysipelotrichaceae bacterium]|nr:tetratricopeptide repeat protein [Erysipelotrichaceae bacterium]
MFWKILNIEPTTDRKAIRSAYMQLLSQTNPEDKPEEFKQLREAYEQALAYAEEHQKNREKTPVELWEEKLSALYDDFQKRIRVENWQKLLNEKVCQSIDTRMDCEDALLRFFMDTYLLPQKVWAYLDSQFSWRDRVDELYEKYPRDFIDYVIVNGANFSDTLPLEMFVPGRDGEICQKYINLYFKINESENLEQALETGKQMLALPESHPYGNERVLLLRIDNDEQEALDELIELQKKHPEDMHIGLDLTRNLFSAGRTEECFSLIEQLKETEPDNAVLRWNEANCLFASGKHQDAVEILNSLLRESGANAQMQYDINEKRKEWNVTLIEELKQQLAEEPGNDSVRSNLGWAYLENDMNDLAREVIDDISESYEDRFDYYNINSSLAMTLEEYEKAIPLLENLQKVASELPEDSEKNISRRRRIGEIWMRLGYCYHALKRQDEAMKAFNEALQYPQHKAEALTHLARISLSDHKYDEVVDYCRQLIREYPSGYQGYLLMATALFRQYNDREAYNAINHALDLCRSDVSVYSMKARILIRNDGLDGAKEIINFLIENGLSEDPTVLFVQGLLKEQEKDREAALSFYEKSLDALNGNEEYYEYGAELLYNYLCLKGEKLDASKPEDRQLMLEIADRGLKCHERHYGLLDYKAWVLMKMKEHQKAKEIYERLLEYPSHSAEVEYSLGYIEYQNLEKNADKALDYFLKSIEKGGRISNHFYAGMCLMYMFRLDEAEKQFLTLKEKEPDELDAPFRLSFVYAMKGDLEKALQEADEAIVNAEKQNSNNVTQYYSRKSVILRKMKRYDEAIDTIRTAMEKYDYPRGNRLIFQIYAQANQFDNAEEHLKKWAKQNRSDEEMNNCQILLKMYRNDFRGASLYYHLHSGFLEQDRMLELDQILSEAKEDYKSQVRQTERWLKARRERNGVDQSRLEGTLSQAYWRIGDKENARLYALEALKEIDERLADFETDKLMFMARKIRILAILGKKQEMEELIEQCQEMPFCQFCPEHHCKDIDIFTMEAYEILGDHQKAYEIACSGHEIHPDEEDFIIARNRLEKKVKK